MPDSLKPKRGMVHERRIGMKATIRLGAAMIGLALLLGTAARAHEGHDHGAPPPPVDVGIAPRADASSEEFELVVVARGDALRIHLDRFRTNEPVTDALVEIDAGGETLEAKPDGAGAYVVAAPALARPGAHDLAITVRSGDLIDILAATLTIPEPANAGTVARSGLLGRIAASHTVEHLRDFAHRFDPGFWAGIGLGFAAGAVAMLSLRRRRRAAPAVAAALAGCALLWTAPPLAAGPAASSAPAAAPLHDLARRLPDGAVFVPKATQRILGIRTTLTALETHPDVVELPGRVIPDPNGSGFVQASVAGRLMPPPGGFPRLGTRVAAGDLLALVQPAIGAADLTAQQQQTRELEQQISIVERRLERLRPIASVIARSQIEDAELELAGLRRRTAELQRAPREPERLVAPVSGVVAAAEAVAGRIADPNAVIFQIVDPSRFWVEALSFQPRSFAADARARLPDGRILGLDHRGSGLADRLQAVPVHFSVEGDPRGLRAGQLLTVIARTETERRGVAIARDGVLRDANGRSIVYEHAAAERFVPHEVRVEPLDGNRVLIVAGLEPGRRIVIRGAELVNQIR